MSGKPSLRIAHYVASLPLRPGLRVLEVGCGPGAAAREISRHIGDGKVVAIDRSANAIDMATRRSRAELEASLLEFRNIAVEDFELQDGDERFDLAFAMRVGALDGRHPEAEKPALNRLQAALKPDRLLFVDSRPPIRGRDIAV
ncbi:MAG: class I SAM-dependent methyltransferase [Alphaproteobacteria bacterium]